MKTRNNKKGATLAVIIVLIMVFSVILTACNSNEEVNTTVYPNFDNEEVNDIVNSISRASANVQSDRITEEIFNNLGNRQDSEVGKTNHIIYYLSTCGEEKAGHYYVGMSLHDNVASKTHQIRYGFTMENDDIVFVVTEEAYGFSSQESGQKLCIKIDDEDWMEWSAIESESSSQKFLVGSGLGIFDDSFFNYSFKDYQYIDGIYVLSTSGTKTEDFEYDWKHVVKFAVKNNRLTWLFYEDTMFVDGNSYSHGFESEVLYDKQTVIFPSDLPPVPQD